MAASAPASRPRYTTGIEGFSVAADNWANRNLFIGRAIHFSIQYVPGLRGPEGEYVLSHLSALSSGTISAVDMHVCRELVRAWNLPDYSPAPDDAEQVGAAAAVLHDLLALDLLVEHRKVACTRADLVNALRPSNPAALMATRGADYIEWLDSQNTLSHLVRELLCYMNPFWRRAGFIYASPFDLVNEIEELTIPVRAGRTSLVLGFEARGLLPPRALA